MIQNDEEEWLGFQEVIKQYVTSDFSKLFDATTLSFLSIWSIVFLFWRQRMWFC